MTKGTRDSLRQANAVFSFGQTILELYTNRTKTGDGVTRWNDLLYDDQVDLIGATGPPGAIGPPGTSGSGTIDHVTNLIKGDGLGAGVDSGIAPATVGIASNTVYNATSWSGNLQVPTKNAVRNKIESLGGGGTVTSVTGTAPVESSGGATPAISLAAATNSTDGYLTATDYTSFDAKANLASPTFTGIPAAPTATAATNTTQIATTAFVRTEFESLPSVSNIAIAPIGFSTDGAGSVVTTGLKAYLTVPYAATITGWNINADGSNPTCTIDVWKIATGTANPTVTNTIMGTKPTLSTGNAKRSTTMTGWTTAAITTGDIIGFNIDAVTVATRISFILEVTKT